MKEDSLRAILAKLGIPVLSRRIKKGGAWLDSRCPFAPWRHRGGQDRRPSFGVRVEPQGISAYACHTCKMHGRVSHLVRQLSYYRGINYGDLMRQADLADASGAVLPDFEAVPELDPPPVPVEEAMYEGVWPGAWDNAVSRGYLQGRGIGEKTAESLGLLYDPDKRRVLFPVRDAQKNLYGFTGRSVLPNGKPRVLDYLGLPKRHLILGEERWVQDRPLTIVEGLFGYAHLVEIGAEEFTNVGALLGSEMTERKAERIRLFDERTFLLLDNDKAGDDGLFGNISAEGERDFESGAVAKLYKYVPTCVPEWPEGKDDPDQLTLAEVRAMIETTGVYVPPPEWLHPVATKYSLTNKR